MISSLRFLSSLLLPPALPPPPKAMLLLTHKQPMVILQNLLSMLSSMESLMTTVATTSSSKSRETDTPHLAATLSLFLMAGSRLSSMLTMEMESSRRSPMMEFLSMDLLLLPMPQLPTMMLLPTVLLLLIHLLMLLLTQCSMVKQISQSSTLFISIFIVWNRQWKY